MKNSTVETCHARLRTLYTTNKGGQSLAFILNLEAEIIEARKALYSAQGAVMTQKPINRTTPKPRIAACPTCKTDTYIAVYTYDSGWRHVECDKCYYLGPGEGSVRAAIKAHNAKAALTASPETVP